MVVLVLLRNSDKIQAFIHQFANDSNVFFIGTAELGELNVPKLIPDLAYLYSEYGRKGSLVKAIERFIDTSDNSNKNIYAIKTTGSQSKAIIDINVLGKDVIKDGVIFKSKYASDIFDDLRISLGANEISFYVNEKLIKSYGYDECVTINNLANKVNNDTNNNKNYVYMETYVDDSVKLKGAFCVNDENIYLHTGNTGLDSSKNDLYISLKNTLSLIKGYEIDVLVPLECYLDDISYDTESDKSHADKLTLSKNNKKTSFYDLVSEFIHSQFIAGKTTIAVLGFNPNIDYDNETKYQILKENKINSKDYISNSFIVVPFNNIYNSKFNIKSNGQTELGIIIKETPPNQAITLKSLSSECSSVERFPNEKLIEISKNQMIPFRYSHYTENTVIGASITTSDSENKGYHYLQNIMMLQFIVKLLNKLLEGYIGEEINILIKNNQIKNDCDDLLSELTSLQYIYDYKVSIVKVSEFEIKIHICIQSIFTLDFLDISNSLKVINNEVFDG